MSAPPMTSYPLEARSHDYARLWGRPLTLAITWPQRGDEISRSLMVAAHVNGAVRWDSTARQRVDLDSFINEVN